MKNERILTGRSCFRSDKKGKLILQVEREYLVTTITGGAINSDWHKDFRDAKLEDLDLSAATIKTRRNE